MFANSDEGNTQLGIKYKIVEPGKLSDKAIYEVTDLIREKKRANTGLPDGFFFFF